MYNDNLFPLIGTGAAGAEVALTSAADVHTFVIPFKCEVVQVGVQVSTAISSSASVVVEFDRTPKSAGAREAAFESVTIPTGVTAGVLYYAKPSTRKLLYEGDIVTVQVATASDSAGKGYPIMLLKRIPEEAANNAAMVESA